MEIPQFELVFEKYLNASDVNKSLNQFIIFKDDFNRFRTMLPPDYEQKISGGKRIIFMAEDQYHKIWRFSCKEFERNQGKLFGQWIKFVEYYNIIENTLLRFEWAPTVTRARISFQLPIVYGGLQMDEAMGPFNNEAENLELFEGVVNAPLNNEAENLELFEGVVNAPLNNEAENLEPFEGVVNAPLNNEAGSGSFEGEFLSEPPFVPTQSGAVNSLNQAVSFNTQGGVDLVNMNERLTKRIKIMQGTIQDCLGVMAPCISNIHSETDKMAVALQELEKLLAPYDPSTEV